MDVTLERPLGSYIDHTLLRPDATRSEFELLMGHAVVYKFATVCIAPHIAVPFKQAAVSEGVKVCTVVGFPHGNKPLLFKLREAEHFLENDIDEIDFVLNVSEVKSKAFPLVIKELRAMGELCAQAGKISKCIVETSLLTEEEKPLVMSYIRDFSPIDYIKTSTGYAGGGATIDDVTLFKSLQRDGKPLIKASGGISELHLALLLIRAGADRLGTSRSVQIMKEYQAQIQTESEDIWLITK